MVIQFQPGQLVECINDRLLSKPIQNVTLVLNGLTRGRIYTVRWSGSYTHEGKTYKAIRLQEIFRGRDSYSGVDDLPYDARRFRPVLPDRLAAFRAMLERLPEVA